MCGINVLYTQKEGLSQRIEQMNKSTIHRGPDSMGIYIDENSHVALGHNRLSIIDLSNHANQPMLSDDENHVIVYNGEIYNFKNIKDKLTEYNFKTKSDTEVILKGYIKYNKSVINEFNGMWGFAIYDKSAQKIIISRDRHGMKPIYYYHSEDHFIVSSEVKGILGSGLVSAGVDQLCNGKSYC